MKENLEKKLNIVAYTDCNFQITCFPGNLISYVLTMRRHRRTMQTREMSEIPQNKLVFRNNKNRLGQIGEADRHPGL